MAKKTPSVNASLIAGEAAIGKAQQELSAAKMLGTFATTAAVQGVVDGFTDFINTKNEEYQGYAQKVLDEAGHLPSAEYDALYNDLMEGKKSYMLGGNKGRALSIRDLNMKAQDYAEYKDLRLNLSELASGESPEGEALSSYFATTPRGQAYLDLLKDSKRLVQKVCPADEPNCADEGRMGVIVDGQWTSISKINQDLNKNLFDRGFQTGLNGLADKVTEASLKVREGEDVQFPEKLINQQLSTLLGNTANRKSVFYDKMFGNTSMYQDLVSKISSGSYSDLGISEDLIKKLDPNGGNVTPEDAGVIVRELFDNPLYADLADAEALRYYGGFLRQNFNNAVPARTKLLPGFFYKGGIPVRIPEDAPYDPAGDTTKIPQEVLGYIQGLFAGTEQEKEVARDILSKYGITIDGNDEDLITKIEDI
jgi:hypothetical protein